MNIGLLMMLSLHAAPDVPSPAATVPRNTPQPATQAASWRSTVERAQESVVKIYGASIGRQQGYGSGVIVSPDGHVVTTLSLLLEAQNLRAVLHDGHIHQARVVYRDEYRQLALLKLSRHAENIDTTAPLNEQMASMNLRALTPGNSNQAQSGDWILALGNPFKIAEGAEMVSVSKGVVTGRGRLDAMQGTQAFPYRGDIILIDAISSTIGSPGSAVVDLDGHWIGLVGEIVQSRLTNTNLNYAYPVEEILAFIKDAQASSKSATRPARVAAGPGYHGVRLSNIGYRKQLPFISGVVRGSPAESAGLRRDDLIISANGTAIPHVRAFNELCERLYAGDELSLVVKRGEQLLSIRVTLVEAPK